MDTSITDAGSADNRTRCGCAATPPCMPETAASVRSTGRVRCDADVSAGVRMYGWTTCGGSAHVCRRESARVGRAVSVQGEGKVRVLSWEACGVARSGARLRDLRGGIFARWVSWGSRRRRRTRLIDYGCGALARWHLQR